MLNVGDKYIHFTKYGSVNIGYVKNITPIYCIDLTNAVEYEELKLVNDKGITYSLDGSDGRFYKINKNYTPEEIQGYRNFLKKASENKAKMKVDTSLLIEKFKKEKENE
jgi:hypothetical protein